MLTVLQLAVRSPCLTVSNDRCPNAKAYGPTLEIPNEIRNTRVSHVGFEVSTAVTMKNLGFWDVAPCGFILNPQTPQPRRRHSS
jgi:hypothetical protein